MGRSIVAALLLVGCRTAIPLQHAPEPAVEPIRPPTEVRYTVGGTPFATRFLAPGEYLVDDRVLELDPALPYRAATHAHVWFATAWVEDPATVLSLERASNGLGLVRPDEKVSTCTEGEGARLSKPIRRVLEAANEPFRDCLLDVLEELPMFRTQVNVRFAIDRDGSVRRGEIETGAGTRDFPGCIARVLRGLRFPKQTCADATTVSWSVLFKSKRGPWADSAAVK